VNFLEIHVFLEPSHPVRLEGYNHYHHSTIVEFPVAVVFRAMNSQRLERILVSPKAGALWRATCRVIFLPDCATARVQIIPPPDATFSVSFHEEPVGWQLQLD
jgi:hypothetical protein